MSEPYEEIIAGEFWLRLPPRARHELICARLHDHVAASLLGLGGFTCLAPRTSVRLRADANLRPDLALVAADDGQLVLVVEVVNAGDHRPDTVLKKALYEASLVPCLWMVDPRYDNVEVYHRGEFGLSLNRILAGAEELTDERLPRLRLALTDLFGP